MTKQEIFKEIESDIMATGKYKFIGNDFNRGVGDGEFRHVAGDTHNTHKNTRLSVENLIKDIENKYGDIFYNLDWSVGNGFFYLSVVICNDKLKRRETKKKMQKYLAKI